MCGILTIPHAESSNMNFVPSTLKSQPYQPVMQVNSTVVMVPAFFNIIAAMETLIAQMDLMRMGAQGCASGQMSCHVRANVYILPVYVHSSTSNVQRGSASQCPKYAMADLSVIMMKMRSIVYYPCT